jgi:predicted phosphodiesterase
VRIAALYDIHGIVHALEAVLDELGPLGVDVIVVGGDVVAGPFPRETFDRLAALGDRCLYVRGNADREVVESDERQSRWCREQLGTRIETMRGWPLTAIVDGVVFCHATLRSDDEIITRLTPDEAIIDAFGDTPLAIVGHTHVQFDRRVGNLRLVNAGSVGWPYEGTPGARWALLDDGVTLRTTPYDVTAAAEAVRASAYPEADEAAETLVAPPSADEASEHFESRRGA